MITDSNQACLFKRSGCGLQEEIDTRIDCVRQIKFHLSQIILGKLGTFFRPDGIDG